LNVAMYSSKVHSEMLVSGFKGLLSGFKNVYKASLVVGCGSGLL
jgi:hypothetical protein